jgi:hypothetical protein
MPRIVAILDDTPHSQKLGLALVGAIGSIVSAVGFTTIEELPGVADRQTLYCPLTLNLPPTFEFWGHSIWQTCRDLDRLRELATELKFQVTDRGNLYLPIIWRDLLPIYTEVIADSDSDKELPSLPIADRDRQSLIEFSDRLLGKIDAPPSVYLVQFSNTKTGIAFDRLFPFPALPALSSVGNQPNLFERYWRCISQS